MNTPTKLLFAATCLLLVGAGCGSTEPATPDTSATTTVAVIKAPATTKSEEQARFEQSSEKRLCTSRGFFVISRFDTTIEKTVQYCQFDDGTECPLTEFANGVCGPGQGAIVQTNTKLLLNEFIETTCPSTAVPVCGVNGHSYENSCIAAQAGIEVAREGMCDEAAIDAVAPERKTAVTTRQTAIQKASSLVTRDTRTGNAADEPRELPPPIDTTPPETEQGTAPEWIATVIALIEASAPTTPRTYIDACSADGARVYLESNGTADIPSTLYDTDGDIICNPNRDFAGICPSVPTNSCTRIYTDSR